MNKEGILTGIEIIDKNKYIRKYRYEIDIVTKDSIYHIDGSDRIKFGQISNIHIDTEGNIWIGTYAQGLFALFPKLFDAPLESFPTRRSSQMSMYDGQKVYVDLQRGGIASFDPDNLSAGLTKVYSDRRAWTSLQSDTGLWVGFLAAPPHFQHSESGKITKFEIPRVHGAEWHSVVGRLRGPNMGGKWQRIV